MWNGSEIKFGDLKITCECVVDGVLVQMQHTKICSDRIFSDDQLCKYIGTHVYCSFNYAAKQLNENVKVTDFNNDILRKGAKRNAQKQGECFKIVNSVLQPGVKVLEGWRNIKCILAAVSVLIGNYVWSTQGNKSLQLTTANNSVGDYMDNAMDYISRASSGDTIEEDMGYQKAARYFQNQLTICKKILKEPNSITCYGIEPPKCAPCKGQEATENTWGPIVLGILTGVLFLLLILCWFKYA